MVLICIDFPEERESVERLGRAKDALVSTFPFLHASNAEKPHTSYPITTKALYIAFSAETGLSETLLGPG